MDYEHGLLPSPHRARTMSPQMMTAAAAYAHSQGYAPSSTGFAPTPGMPLPTTSMHMHGDHSNGRGRQSVYIDNSTVLFSQTNSSSGYPMRSDLPLTLAPARRPEVLVPFPAGQLPPRPHRQTMPSSIAPPLPFKPPILRHGDPPPPPPVPALPPPSLPPKPVFATSSGHESSLPLSAPLSFYSSAVAMVAPVAPAMPVPEQISLPPPPPSPSASTASSALSLAPVPVSAPARVPSHPPSPTTSRAPFRDESEALPERLAALFQDSARIADMQTTVSIAPRRATQSSLLPSSSSGRTSRSPARSLPSTPSPQPRRLSPPVPPLPSPSAAARALAFYSEQDRRQMEEDEALARRLAAEEEAKMNEPELANVSPDLLSGAPDLPSSAYWSRRPSLPQVDPGPRMAPPHGNAPPPAPPTGYLHAARRAYSTPDLVRPRVSPHPTMQYPMPEDEDEEEGQSAPIVASRSPNQFVEPDLLVSVSFGFGPPAMNAQRMVMRDPIPTIISLPYGKAPPMHIQAGSWRLLLRLLAKLGGTRVEPAVESHAVTNGMLKLRVVVQFIKNHLASSDWRTVLYLTIDHPTPPKLPTSARANDPNALPFSYTLSSLPTLLRDGHDSTLSKYYTIPETASMPLPNLPITLPDLAVYLAAALEDSRKVRDAANAHRRLAKLVDAFYPAEVPASMAGDDDEPRRGWRRLLKRPKQPTQSVNADMYDLVTPFPFVAMSAQTPGGY